MGYHRAGFEVVGVDREPQPRYPFEFHQADALEYLREHGEQFDVIHASPPCQFATNLRHLGAARNGSYPDDHLNLIGPTRDHLKALGIPYVIENVAGARHLLVSPIFLCGSQFNLKVYRHRYFEISPFLVITPPHHPHRDQTPSAGNGISPKGFISVAGSGGVKGMNSKEIVAYWSASMGIDWMTRAELAEAIPPAYSEYIGRQLIAILERQNA